MREQHQLSYNALFAESHCLSTGNVNKWYWHLLEDHEGDDTFDYVSLKRELLDQFKAADSDCELIREITERNSGRRNVSKTIMGKSVT